MDLIQNFHQTQFLGIISGYTILVIIHLFGVAVGAGAAFFSDFLFTHILKDRKVDHGEFGILKLASKVVWLGLGILIVSGFLIFLGDPEQLMSSSKFLLKMTAITVLTVNGIFFHVKHLPFLKSFVGKDLSRSKKFVENSRGFFMSGGVSGISWATAIVLGGLPYVDIHYIALLGMYVVALVAAAVGGLFIHRLYFPAKR